MFVYYGDSEVNSIYNKICKIRIISKGGQLKSTEVEDQDGNIIPCFSIGIQIDEKGVRAFLEVRPEYIEIETDKIHFTTG